MRYLPVEPLLREIELRGGLLEVIDARAGNSWQNNSPSNRSSFWGQEVESLQVSTYPEFERAERQIYRAKRAGQVTDRWADEFCCHVLKVHPCTVWGSAWFEWTEEDDKRVVSAEKNARRRAREKEAAA